jgi:1,4-dihydroxy-2-naphthoyl-CoA hydrolase
MSDPVFEHRFRVALHDTDAAGVLFFAHLFRHAHDAYEAWMASIGFPLNAMIRDGRLKLPLVHAEADYRRPIRHGDQVRVQLEVADVGERKFRLRYRFLTADTELVASAETVHAGINAAGRTGLPHDLVQALSAGVARTTQPSDPAK